MCWLVPNRFLALEVPQTRGDNAVAESFFSSLKKERIKKRIYKNRDEATADISDYIDTFYNQTRRHSHLGGVSPAEFEVAAKGRRAVH
jgi:putative transposase